MSYGSLYLKRGTSKSLASAKKHQELPPRGDGLSWEEEVQWVCVMRNALTKGADSESRSRFREMTGQLDAEQRIARLSGAD